MSIGTFLKTQRLIARAKKLRQACERHNGEVEAVLGAIRLQSKFSLVQKRREIAGLLERIKPLRPGIIVDIGSSGGGTIRLFSHFAADDARILSIDINNTPLRQQAFPHLVREGQSLNVYNGSSYDEKTVAFLKQWLNGEEIGLLFIDGDHEYDGVARDFRLYSPFVKEGGIVAFHDIVEDYKTRFGRTTPAYVGEVPRFWREIRSQYPHAEELIQDPEQDGFGIGVIRWQKN